MHFPLFLGVPSGGFVASRGRDVGIGFVESLIIIDSIRVLVRGAGVSPKSSMFLLIMIVRLIRMG